MRRRKRNIFQKTAAILVSGLLCVSAAFGGVEPITVEAEEVVGAGNEADIADTVSGNEPGSPKAELSGEQADRQAEEIALADNTVSGNEAAARELAENSAGDTAVSGVGWELDADGTLTINSDEGMKDWKDNGWSIHKEKVRNVIIKDSVGTIVHWAFQDCVNIISVVISDGVKEIGSAAFSGCDSLLTVTMPDSIVFLYGNVFDSCDSLESVTLSAGLESISGRVFGGCINLKQVTIPEGIKEIGDNAFSQCSGLETIILPKSLEKIGAMAFYDCVKLKKVIMLSDPPGIENLTFGNCGFVTDGTAPGIVVSEDKAEEYRQKWAGKYDQYIRAHSHSWETAWTSNPFHHWHECTAECTIINIADKDGYAIHTEDAGTITKQPTQTESGIKSYRCGVCGYEMRTETIPAAGTAEGNGSGDRDDKGEGGETPKNENAGSNSSENGIANNIPAEKNTIEDITGNNVAVHYDSSGSDISNAKTQPVKDREPKTGDSTRTELYATLAMVMGLTYLLLYFTDRRHGMTEETKKELVSKLIGWARQGGYCRRLAAIAAIFVLLAYYHGIGKKIALEWKEVYGE